MPPSADALSSSSDFELSFPQLCAIPPISDDSFACPSLFQKLMNSFYCLTVIYCCQFLNGVPLSVRSDAGSSSLIRAFALTLEVISVVSFHSCGVSR